LSRVAHFLRRVALLVFVLALLGPVHADEHIIRLATTTSTENSGLLGELLPAFEQATGYRVHVIAVGTGKALRMGRDGDVDVVMVHARPDEDKFVAAGFGIHRRDLMYNDFVIVGPASDPAGIRGTKDASTALARIARKNAVFVSRGDNSGTHKKERRLWASAGITPQGSGYRAVGQGMEKTLQMANELQGYTLTDRGTWLSLNGKFNLAILLEGDTRLFNPYGVIAVNPARYPDVNLKGAVALIDWLTSAGGQKRIAAFQIHGQPLFHPLAIKAQGNAP